jgi:hypothetical protein
LDLDPIYAFALQARPPGAGKVVVGVGRPNPRFPYVVRVVLTRRGSAVACPRRRTLEKARRFFTANRLRRMGRSGRHARRAVLEFGAEDAVVDGLFYTREGLFRPRSDHAVHHLKPATGDGTGRVGMIDLGEVFVVMAGDELASRGLLLTPSEFPGVCEVANLHTEPKFRRKGMARSVVSAVTQEILDRGCLPVFSCSLDNAGPLRICRSLGYRRFAIEVTGLPA